MTDVFREFIDGSIKRLAHNGVTFVRAALESLDDRQLQALIDEIAEWHTK